ncbi:putative 3-keto-acyl-CoA thiolase [Gonapodya prolifera JEL478]|uniref:propanoyl-CoA C-acyltransferase n=1 Tax=Gonapodya prolifera (strain JEL478) TaxID=1344416 RepID=A0A139AFM4_GONPJ|nr:putative 3-keto-acyl-CoA thiolase [Gonapodya prolifera JEL478]|eukprot:KXS15499.1 putative 3-keto-acyl-CoA thiolase [Gonapodya prolifera JEL478]
MSGKGRKVFIVGVGMTHFDKPGRRKDVDYPDYGIEAGTKALLDANISYDDVEFAAVGYCYGDSTCGQRVLYGLGMNQIPIINVNNNCSTGSTAIYVCRQAIEGGLYDCALALGFEKMSPGSLQNYFKDREAPTLWSGKIMAETRGIDPKAPGAAQTFGNAGIEYMEKYGAKPIHMAMIGEKNHRHSTLNPYSQFMDQYTLDQVVNSRKIFGPLTMLQCCPTSDGSGAVILCSEEFVKKHHLEPQAIEIVAQTMATDSFKPVATKSSMENAGFDMTKRAALDAYKIAGITRDDVGVVELHDCFSANELITYDALGLSDPGKAHILVESGNATHGGKFVINPSGGLISKGHPLGATGLAQATELTWQLRGWCGKRQVPNLKYALQHNVGLGGAVVIGIYKKATFANGAEKNLKGWQDPRERFGYNPAVECRGIKKEDLQKVMAKGGSLAGKPDALAYQPKL